MSVAKKALRRLMLGKLKQSALADPARVAASSQAVCDQLWKRTIFPLYSNTASGEQDIRGTVLAYLPMFYEVDLRPLIERVWEHNAALRKSRTASTTICKAAEEVSKGPVVVLVPHTVELLSPPPAPSSPVVSSSPSSGTRAGGGFLVFVELASPEVLAQAFVPHGKLQYLDLTTEDRDALYTALRIQMSGRDGDIQTCRKAQRSVDESNNDDDVPVSVCDAMIRGYFESPTTGTRLSYLCSSSAAAAAAIGRIVAPKGPTQQTAAGCRSSTSSRQPLPVTELVVLAPAAAFDECGQRLGKGGGFYDRFLQSARESLADQGVPVRAVGVAFDEQVLPCRRRPSDAKEAIQLPSRNEPSDDRSVPSSDDDGVTNELPTEAWDQRMDFIVTSTQFIDVRRS